MLSRVRSGGFVNDDSEEGPREGKAHLFNKALGELGLLSSGPWSR